MIRDKDGKPGLRIESAASVTLRDTIAKHMEIFSHVIRADRVAGQSVTAAYVDGLAGAAALVIAGGHGSKDEVTGQLVTLLRTCIERDLRHLRKN